MVTSTVMTPITYRGELAATATGTRCLLADWLRKRPMGDPDLRVVAAMCLFAMEVAAGRLPGPYRDDLALLFAREMLIDDLEFELYADETDAALAERFRVPLEHIADKRDDLTIRRALSEH
jgi:hypothetical protein